MTPHPKLISWAMGALVFLSATAASAAASPADFDSSPLEKLAIQEGGRKKPFHTFAVETLQSISGRASVTHEQFGKLSAVPALLSLWLQADFWLDQPVILLNYKPLKEILGLPASQKRFSYRALSSNPELHRLATEVMALRNRGGKVKLDRQQKEVEDVTKRILLFESIGGGDALTFIPNPDKSDARWLVPAAAASAYPEGGAPVARSFQALDEAFRAGNVSAFDEQARLLARLVPQLKPDFYPSARMLGLERFYQGLHPFRWAWMLYLAAALVLALTSLAFRGAGYAAGWVLVTAGFGMQVLGFVCRILIAGRGPVTNMYETVIWVAFGTVLFALILEAIYRCRYFLLAATPAAVVSLILADTQTSILDSSISPLVPVLRDNFWLSTHVTSITLSYAAFLLALAVGHIALGKVLFGRRVSAALYTYLYRALQVGVLLLAIGTILGGVWANYSWGRFWDWDPKETWALITLLCYLALLHGRVAGWWNGFGLAVGSIVGFMSVLMAWYGVNFVLGQGLHSYGFGTGGFPWVAGFCLADLLFAAAAVVRYRLNRTGAPAPAPAGGDLVDVR